jgi:hypothetical protein
MRANIRTNLIKKLSGLLEKIDIGAGIEKGRLVALKLHFGEKGNTGFIRPVFVRQVVDALQKKKLSVFLTDTNTLYRGSRNNAAIHLDTAIQNGFAYSVVNAPLVIADGLKATDQTSVAIKGDHYKTVPIGSALVEADALVVLSHFKAHEATGFGGAIKNLGMGGASRKGKLSMHSDLSPKISPKFCKGDNYCEIACTFDAISMVEKKAVIDNDTCTGCGECLGVCPHGAINIQWNAEYAAISEKMAEFALGTVSGKAGQCWYVNFVTRVTPACDCYAHSDASIVPDLGMFASTDPVALDQACYDAVTEAAGIPGTALGENTAAGTDKFKTLYPKLDPQSQLAHAEKIGLGTREYELVRLS